MVKVCFFCAFMLVRFAGIGKIMVIQTPYFLSETELNHLKNWFAHHVRSFYGPDPVIQQAMELKEKHSLRVCGEILGIGWQH